MPQLIINNNGLDLEEIERMQDEKDTYVISVSESVPKEIKRRVESGE